jgi:hypothetical protein
MTDTILWRRLDLPGHEIAGLKSGDEGWQLYGTAVFAFQGQACKLDYDIRCQANWRTAAARIQGAIGRRVVDIEIAVDGRQQWYVNGLHSPVVAGCLDLDLGFSPATNLLPIRRLALAVGASAEVRAAWLPFPVLELEPLPQTYRRDGARRYRYESRGGRFARDLAVDKLGFVTDYPGLWQVETGLK